MTDAVPAPSNARDALRSLVAQKDSLEAQLDALNSQSAAGQKLVDDEGFPRGDLDVHAIRNARAEMAKLQTDHQRLMKQIESSLFSVHAEARAAKLAANPQAQVSSAPAARPAALEGAALEEQIRVDAAKTAERYRALGSADAAAASAAAAPAQPPAADRPALRPFYRINAVSPDSPAESAGLKVGDLVLEFGSVSAENVSAAAMAAVVSASIGRGIHVVVEREGKRKELRLVPQQWAGRGMLGCHLVDV